MPIDIIQNIEKGVLPNTATTQLFLMDVEKFLDALPMQPIFDLVVTSPPYNIGKEYVFHLWCLSNSKKCLLLFHRTSYCLTSPLTIWKDNGKAPKFRFHVLKDNL